MKKDNIEYRKEILKHYVCVKAHNRSGEYEYYMKSRCKNKYLSFGCNNINKYSAYRFLKNYFIAESIFLMECDER